jgi:hypothetical protein
LAAAAFVLLLLVPAAHARPGSVVWSSPTRADGTRFTVTAGSNLIVKLSASTSTPDATVAIEAVDGLPRGAVVSSSGGSVARAIFRWTPTVVGEYAIRFGASTGPGASATILAYVIDVREKVPYVHYPRSYGLTDDRIAHWAVVPRRVAVHSQPRRSARVVTTLETATSDGTQNLVLVLDGVDRSATETWYRVRLPILPNNSTGWVPGSALGELATTHTHLYVDRAKLMLTLKRDGATVFETRVGVGRSFWPTPRGEFYIRDRLSGFGNPVYGPVAFGTSARSATLTDWPGGGFVGIHGTNQPQILPGYVSHGCIRLRNEAILQLARLMQVGTPLTIH